MGGGNGMCDSCGGHRTLSTCGSRVSLQRSLHKIKDASERILRERARAAESENIAIIGHYPPGFQRGNFRQMYLNDLPREKQESTKVFSFYGHLHTQRCDVRKANECVEFLTGGAGGCCSAGDTPAGFAVVSWDNSGKQVVECFV